MTTMKVSKSRTTSAIDDGLIAVQSCLMILYWVGPISVTGTSMLTFRSSRRRVSVIALPTPTCSS
jgi:hypothetical protein